MRNSLLHLILQTVSILLLYISLANASAPALSSFNPSSESASTPTPTPTPTSDALNNVQCESGRTEDAIICDANDRTRDTIQQVIAEDDTAQISSEQPSSLGGANDAWVNAYNQWVKKSKSDKSASDSAKRAMDAAKRHHESQRQNKSEHQHEVLEDSPDAPDDQVDDELKLITKAAQDLSRGEFTPEQTKRTLELVDDLCVSGDNGRQFAASGGIHTVLRLVDDHHVDNAITVSALRALATCAQNNAPVFLAATDANAIPVVAHIGRRATEKSRAAALRVLLALSDSPEAATRLWKSQQDILAMIVASFESTEKNGDVVRCQLRSLALVDACLRVNHRQWVDKLRDGKVVNLASAAMQSDNIDLKEAAARVVRVFREFDKTNI